MDNNDFLFSREEKEILTDTIVNKASESYDKTIKKHYCLLMVVFIIGCFCIHPLFKFFIFCFIILVGGILITNKITKDLIEKGDELMEDVFEQREQDPSITIEKLVEYIKYSDKI